MKKLHLQKLRIIFWILLIILFFMTFVYLPVIWNWPATRGANFTVHFFDVGQGDSELVQCGNAQVLIDGGPNRTVLQRLGRVMPFTDRRIENVILSHPHADHIFGLFAVMERYQVGRLVVSDFVVKSELGAELIRLARARGIAVITVKTGDKIEVGDCGELTVLWSGIEANKKINGADDEPTNDQSLVLQLRRHEALSLLVLFTGDISGTVENLLLANHVLQPTMILKVPHHGSRYSSISEFIAAVQPQYAIIEVGENNYSQPSATILNRFQTLKIRLQRTDKNGTVSFSFDDDEHFSK
jgi:competence protein ComEC